MSSLGYYLLLAAFVVCAYAAAISVAGARRRSRALIESGIGAFYLMTAIMGVASAVIVYAFVVGDYSIRYVQRYSDSVQPMFYKLTSYWGGLDGSIMFWVSLLSAFGSAAVYINRERHRELIPYVVTVISVVQMFFLFLMIVHNNPFQTFLTESPTDGTGLNPLLQNFYMAIHPPTMYLGFVGLTIPYAFGMAALITGYLDDSWLRAVRRWTMIAWLFLSVGLGLGMIWAYEELGWGGYWMWDPVENAGLLPWFTATAFLHSVMVQEKRGMLRVWNVCLVITTFFLTIFGTFMTRSGVVQSVHAFGDDPELARLFTIFMIALVVVSFGFVIYRLPLLRARNELDSWLSREAAFMMNNWILLFSAFFVLFATMFPTLSEAIRGERLTVGPPFFNQWMLPIGLTLLLLTGIGPLLAWRKSTVVNLRDQFLFPVSMGLVDRRSRSSPSACGCGRRASASRSARSSSAPSARSSGAARGCGSAPPAPTSSPRWSAWSGATSGATAATSCTSAWCSSSSASPAKGSSRRKRRSSSRASRWRSGDFVVRHDALSVTDDGQKQMITAHVTVLRDGKPFAEMYPAKWIFRKHEESPTTEVAIHRGFAQDVYLVLASFDAATQTASLAVDINPLVNWVWMGFGLLALGIGIALLPDAAFAFATAPLPANAATTALILLAVVLSQGVALAQDTVPAIFRSPLERRVAERDHVRLRRLPAVGRVVRHDELPRQRERSSPRSSSTSRRGRTTTRSWPASCASTAATTC